MAHEYKVANQIKNASLKLGFGPDRDQFPGAIAFSKDRLVREGVDIAKLIEVLPKGWSHAEHSTTIESASGHGSNVFEDVVFYPPTPRAR